MNSELAAQAPADGYLPCKIAAVVTLLLVSTRDSTKVGSELDVAVQVVAVYLLMLVGTWVALRRWRGRSRGTA